MNYLTFHQGDVMDFEYSTVDIHSHKAVSETVGSGGNTKSRQSKLRWTVQSSRCEYGVRMVVIKEEAYTTFTDSTWLKNLKTGITTTKDTTYSEETTRDIKLRYEWWLPDFGRGIKIDGAVPLYGPPSPTGELRYEYNPGGSEGSTSSTVVLDAERGLLLLEQSKWYFGHYNSSRSTFTLKRVEAGGE